MFRHQTIAKPAMTGETLFDVNATFKKLDSVIMHARFGGDRSGMLPPDLVAPLRDELADALATIDSLLAE